MSTVLAAVAPRTGWRATAWYALVTVAMTWPLATGLTRDIPWDLGDSLLNCWILGWNAERLLRLLGGDLTALHGFYDANIFYPQPLTLAYSETLFAQTLQVLPVYALTKNLILCYNLLFLSSFVLSGLGAYLLAREFTGDWRAGFAAGLVFAFLPWRYAQAPHLQVLTTQWMPLALYALRRYFVTRRATPLAGAAAALVLNNHSNGYYLLFFAPVVAAYVLWEMTARGLLRDLRVWAGMAATAAVTAALTVPFLLPYLWLRESTGEHRGLGEVVWFSADVMAYFTASEAVRVWGGVMRAFPKPEGDLFAGLLPLLLAAVAAALGWRRAFAAARGADPRAQRPARIVRALGWLALVVLVVYAGVLVTVLAGQGGRFTVGPVKITLNSVTRALWTLAAASAVLVAVSARARRMARDAWRSPIVFALLLAFAAAWLSLGPQPQSLGRSLNAPSLYAPLYEHVPGFDGLRVPARFAVLVFLGLSLLAAFGVRDLARRGWRAPALLALAALFLAESTAVPVPLNLSTSDRAVAPPAGVSPASEAPPVYRFVATLPADAVLAELPFGDTSWEIRHVYHSTMHWRRLVNGYSGGFPASYLKLRGLLDDPRREPAEAWAGLLASGATHVVLHEDAYLAPELADLRQWLERGGATALARFDTATVYRLPRPGA
ncbi:MAG: hypothetical protein MUF60_06625 [Vicinamibacterales bacterium]|nr:hypothetical protein [Vicinamibacterales bacterium]